MRLRVFLKLTIVIFGFVLNTSDEIRYISIPSTKYIFQDKLCCVCCDPGLQQRRKMNVLPKPFEFRGILRVGYFVRDV
jgi:hypothetical protein